MDDTTLNSISPPVTPRSSCYLPPESDDIPLADRKLSGTSDVPRIGKEPGRDFINSKTVPQQPYERKKRYDVGWRCIVRNFTPSWFAVTMGTGICGVLLHALPWQARWLEHLSIIFFALNTTLFGIFTILTLLRYTIWPEIWTVMTNDPVHSLFLGTVPVGFATLIQLWVAICVPALGPWAGTFAWVLWMVDAIVSAIITISIPFLLMSRHPTNSLEGITAVQLLPVVSTIFAAGAGARIASILTNPQHALGTVICCYVLWGMGVPLAMVVMVMYYQRLCLHKIPSREVIASCFIPLGPLGFGGFTIMELGRVALDLFPQTGMLSAASFAGQIAYCIGFLIALIMWGFGLMWLSLAFLSIYNARLFPFNMGWWAFTFPLGVFSASTLQLGQEIPSRFFDVLGTIFSVSVILLWIVVTAGTAKGVWNGKLFQAPCLAQLPEKYKYPKENGMDETNVAEDNGHKVGLPRAGSHLGIGIAMYRCKVRVEVA